MDLYKIILDIFPVILFAGSALFFFAGIKNKQDVLTKTDIMHDEQLKEIEKKIELMQVQDARRNTDLEILKLRVDLLDRAIK